MSSLPDSSFLRLSAKNVCLTNICTGPYINTNREDLQGKNLKKRQKKCPARKLPIFTSLRRPGQPESARQAALDPPRLTS